MFGKGDPSLAVRRYQNMAQLWPTIFMAGAYGFIVSSIIILPPDAWYKMPINVNET